MRRSILVAVLATVVCLCAIGTNYVYAADQSTLGEIVSRGKIVVGVAAYIKPLAFTNPENGEIIGLIPDLVKLYAKKLDVQIEFNDFKWAGLFPALDTKKVDFLAAHITTTIPRTAKLDLTEPYIYTGSRVLVRKDLPVENISQLDSDKYTFGESKGSVYLDVVAKTFPKAKVQKYDTFADSLQGMKVGRLDATIDDEVIILFGGLKGNEDKFKVLKENLSPQSYRFACRLGDGDLRRSLDIFLEEIKLSGEYKEIYEKWFSMQWEPRQIGY
jgi:ABC-type amino acid transport substrate-binding protein